MRALRAVLLGLVLTVPPWPAVGQSPSTSPSPSIERVVPVVGPDALGPAPSPPIGPEWHRTLDARGLDGYRAEVVRCGGGFTLMASGHDRNDRRRAQFWTSRTGSTWRRAGRLRPAPGTDPYWLVTDLVVFRRGLFALGGDDQQLAVWRSPDCGRTWRRLWDPSFDLGRDAFGLSHGAEAAVTADRMLVVAHQGGEEIPVRQWAWTMDPGGAWRRVRGGLEGAVDELIGSTADAFFGMQRGRSGLQGDRTVTSSDGETWTTLGRLPAYGSVRLDSERPRFVSVTQEPHDAEAAPPMLWSSSDGRSWTPLAAGTPSAITFGGVAESTGGLLVWIVDAGTDEAPWSWVGVSEDAGTTWSISAGWPGLTLAGGKSIAINAHAIVIAGGQSNGTQAWTLLR